MKVCRFSVLSLITLTILTVGKFAAGEAAAFEKLVVSYGSLRGHSRAALAGEGRSSVREARFGRQPRLYSQQLPTCDGTPFRQHTVYEFSLSTTVIGSLP